MPKKLNRYTQWELALILWALENSHPEYTKFCAAKPGAIKKTKLRLTVEEQRAK